VVLQAGLAGEAVGSSPRSRVLRLPDGLGKRWRGGTARVKEKKPSLGAEKGRGIRRQEGNEVSLSAPATSSWAAFFLPVLPVLAYTSS